jgi:hypothetical protein
VRGGNLRWGCAVSGGEGRVLVVVNKGDKEETVDLPMDHTALTGCSKLSALWGADGAMEIKAEKLHVVVSAGSAKVVGVN